MALMFKKVSSLIGEAVLCTDPCNTRLTVTGAVREMEKAFRLFNKKREVPDCGENQGSFSYELYLNLVLMGG